MEERREQSENKLLDTQLGGPQSQGSSPEIAEKPKRIKKWRRVKRAKKVESFIPAEIFEIDGVVRIFLSSDTQKAIHCIVGEDVSDENPWTYVLKEDLEDQLEYHENESEFFPLKDGILAYSRKEMLMGFIPSENDEMQEFYICIKETAENAVTKIKQKVTEQREERLNNTLIKTIRPWKTLGSALEVDEEIVKDTRALLEVEVESVYPFRSMKPKFKLRLVSDAKDGYMDCLSLRQTFSNLQRRRLEVGVQVTPSVISNGIQTYTGYPKHVSTQYKYEYEEIKTFDKEFLAHIKRFSELKMSDIDEMLAVNSCINLYKNDYFDLVKENIRLGDSQYSAMKEMFMFYDQDIGKGKIITSLSWHPMLSGTVACSYSTNGLGVYKQKQIESDTDDADVYKQPVVLLWCLNDSLAPKLYLKCPRTVTALMFSPYDENILVGGCVNGQVVIWDITDKIRQVEELEILPPNRQRYRIKMYSLMTWMKDVRNIKEIEATVVSDLRYSHSSQITMVRCNSPYREISKSGKLSEIPEEEQRTSHQFLTSSSDGTVLIWDLLSKPTGGSGGYRPHKRSRRLKRRPSALLTAVSPLRELNRIFKPIFKVNVFAPNTTRPLGISTINISITLPLYEEKYPDPTRKFNMQDRIQFKPKLRKCTEPLANILVGGTMEGDFFSVGWDGFEFNAGAIVNQENGKIENFSKYHDGPVVTLSRSTIMSDLILTVGGKVFAIWKLDFLARPFFWRRSKLRYTFGSWNIFRPALFRLTRYDGCVEIWNLEFRNDRCQYFISVSKGPLLGAYPHPLILKQNIMGMSDCTSALRLFFVGKALTGNKEEDELFLRELVNRDINMKLKFKEWQDKWKEKNAELIQFKKEKEMQARRQKEEMEAERLKAQKTEEDNEVTEVEQSFAEQAKADWKQREIDRMAKGLLNKKQLHMDVLLKQQLPALKAEEEIRKIEEKRVRRQSISQKIFNDTVAILFPDAVKKKPIPPPDPYNCRFSMEDKANYYRKYEKTEEEYEVSSETRLFYRPYDWLALTKKGEERRRWINGFYEKASHRNRLIRDKQKPKPISISLSYEPASTESVESMDDGFDELQPIEPEE